MTPRYPTTSRFRRHQQPRPLPRVLLAATVVCGGLYFIFRPDKAPDPAVAQQVQPEPAAPVPASKPTEKTESKPKAILEMKPEAKTESKAAASKPLASAEKSDPPPSRPAATAELRAAKAESKAEPKADSKAEPKPESRPESRFGKQEIKLDIHPENRSESKPEVKPSSKTPDSGPENRTDGKIPAKGESKGEAGAKKSEASAKDKHEPAPAESSKPPLLPQPKAEEEIGFHPLPDGLAPKPREQEMDLTFYKGLAMKKMVLPEEPSGKKVIPPFLAGASPASASVAKRPDSPGAAASSKPAAEANKKAADSKPATLDKKKNYQVQVAILSEQKNATAMADVLRSQGAPNPRVSPITYSSGKVVFRVRLGPFANQSEAAKAGQRWQHPGQPALITAVDD
ncbi:MAG: SPOR domain-containing protein [Magnetococcales bacterium]|nr:SPOR domain-containing protein [Magnetococcales bacterium]MBF0115988.1 SPOR domain-containing protein [Magnetococcales bacterium]